MHFHLEGLPPHDGDFPFPADLTNRELHTIKLMAGVRAGELEEAMTAGDTDILLAMLVIALQRAGHKVDTEQIWDTTFGDEAGKIQFIVDEEDEVEKLPPPSEPAESAEDSGQNGASGESSRSDGENPASDPSPTGLLDSVTGAAFDRVTSET